MIDKAFDNQSMNHHDAASVSEELPNAELRQLREWLLQAASGNDATSASGLERTALLEQLLGVAVCRKLGIFRVPPDFRLSVVMPVYNEIRTLAQVIERVRATDLPIELIVVDDGSTDGSREFLAVLRDKGEVPS